MTVAGLRRFFIVLLFAFLFIQQAAAQRITTKVVSIADGDTLTVLVDREQIGIRLEGIDCPEKGRSMAWPC